MQNLLLDQQPLNIVKFIQLIGIVVECNAEKLGGELEALDANDHGVGDGLNTGNDDDPGASGLGDLDVLDIHAASMAIDDFDGWDSYVCLCISQGSSLWES